MGDERQRAESAGRLLEAGTDLKTEREGARRPSSSTLLRVFAQARPGACSTYDVIFSFLEASGL